MPRFLYRAAEFPDKACVNTGGQIGAMNKFGSAAIKYEVGIKPGAAYCFIGKALSFLFLRS